MADNGGGGGGSVTGIERLREHRAARAGRQAGQVESAAQARKALRDAEVRALDVLLELTGEYRQPGDAEIGQAITRMPEPLRAEARRLMAAVTPNILHAQAGA